MKILLAEDDPKVASFITNGLSENGHSVDHVTDGREALTYCLYNSCDLAILDRMMPGMDGLSVVRAPMAPQLIRSPMYCGEITSKNSLPAGKP